MERIAVLEAQVSNLTVTVTALSLDIETANTKVSLFSYIASVQYCCCMISALSSDFIGR